MSFIRPFAKVKRQGFEVTGYVLNLTKRTLWDKPVANNTRQGFEVTGYLLTRVSSVFTGEDVVDSRSV